MIKFIKNDLYFESVIAFFVSWITYSFSHSSLTVKPIDGRLRGIIIPQIIFSNCTLIQDLRAEKDISAIAFEINMSDPGIPKGKKVKTDWLMQFWCQQMLGHCYELSKDIIINKYGQNRKQTWPETLQYFYHIRNACFHGNKFNILPYKISKNIATVWRGSKIDYTDNSKQLAGAFFMPADFITLLFDVHELLKIP